MEDTTFKITDYTVMADSALQMNDTMNTSSLSLEEIGTTFASLFDQSIFDGPIAVDCKEKEELIIKALNASVVKLADASSTLNEMNKTYQETDKTASDEIAGV